MRYFTLMFVSAVLIFQTGCFKYWYQEGKSFDECLNDREECFNELSKRTDFTDPSYEHEYMDTCMQQKGYRSVFADDLPLDVKRESPESRKHWQEHGVAGTVTGP